MINLYMKDAKGKIRIWSIEELVDGFVVSHGVLGGSIQEKFEEVLDGKAGRSQSEQIDLQIKSRINKQLDIGYVHSLEEAKVNKVTNSIGLLKPMLARKIDEVSIDYKSAFVQRKYDGNRCLITRANGEIIAYSRNGKPINSIDHILSGLDLQDGETIDGELYCHGESLQKIVSLIKRKQPESKKIRFNLYDYVSDKPFTERLKEIQRFNHESIDIVETIPVSDLADVMDLLKQFRDDGYEGAIVRHGSAGYQDGRRSSSLLKVKEWLDMEFPVIDIKESKDGWALLRCVAPNGNIFGVTCHGDVSYKQHVLKNKEYYIGNLITIEFAYLTKDGIPFHPIAKAWR